MFRGAIKDRIPTHQLSGLIFFQVPLWQMVCGKKTLQRRETRIAQRIPACLTEQKTPTNKEQK